jgi:hypothetical protein
MELHPVDSIRGVPEAQQPRPRKEPILVQACGAPGIHELVTERDEYLRPIRAVAGEINSTPPSANSVVRFQEIIDNRFTDMSTVGIHAVTIAPDQLSLHVHVRLASPAEIGHFSAVYLVWWEELSTPRPVPRPAPTPTRRPPPVPEPCQRYKPPQVCP